MQFGRATQRAKFSAEIQEEHVRRRISETETAIKIERVGGKFGLEALRKNNLKNIAIRNICFCTVHHLFEIVDIAGKAGYGWSRAGSNRLQW